MLRDRKLGILGLGKLGEAIVQGLLARGEIARERVIASVRTEASAARLCERTGLAVTTDSAAVVEHADVLLIAVKPQAVAGLLASVGGRVRKNQLVVSVCASVTIDAIERHLPAAPAVIRVMPNTPCLLGCGMSVLAAGTHATADDLAAARAIFDAVGRTTILEERLLDAVTGLSGSGPAYMYVVIESLAEAGVKLGIPRETATLLSAQTVLGAARMVLERGAHPALLKDEVTTPAGCTIDGLLALEEGRLRVTLVRAVVKAARRAAQLAG